MSATYNKYLLDKGLKEIVALNGQKSFRKFLDVYITDPLEKELSNFPTFCNGLKYLPFGNNIMLRAKSELINSHRSRVIITGENDEIILTDEIPSAGNKNLDLLLITVSHPKTFQQKTFLIENNF